MKKKVVLFFTAVMITACLTACGDKGSEQKPETVTEKATEKATEEAKRDLPEGDYEELGEGTAYISTAGGTSEDGNVPVIYASSDTSLLQIGLDAWDFNGSALSYVYVDGMLLTKEQLADTQTSLNLEAEQLTEGVHKVEVVQYADDNPDAEMITYKSASYEVKEQ